MADAGIEPGMEPPPGEETNFDNPDREMFYICIVSNAIAIPVCTLFFALRLWARIRLRTGLQRDDIACIIGYIGFMGYCAICLLMLRYGGGLNQWNVPADQVPDYNKTVYATMVNYGPTVFAIKAAILLFLAKIFAPFKTYVKWIYGFLGLMAIYYVVMLVLKIFICRPIPMFWGGAEDGECFNQRALILTDNVISLVTDIAVLLLPCPMTKNLQVGIMAKIKIGLVFGVGGLACIFSLIRLVFIVNDGESEDQTYHFVRINLTGIAECGIGLVCACFPLLPALWKSILHKDTKPGYSSNNSKSFEMMNSSSQKHTRNTTGTRTRKTATYAHDNDSDENDLIIDGHAHVTTNIRGGGDLDDLERGSSPDMDSAQRKMSLDDAQIQVIRTVEVRQS